MAAQESTWLIMLGEETEPTFLDAPGNYDETAPSNSYTDTDADGEQFHVFSVNPALKETFSVTWDYMTKEDFYFLKSLRGLQIIIASHLITDNDERETFNARITNVNGKQLPGETVAFSVTAEIEKI